MKERRMFSLSVCDTDWFLDLPLSTQALYFHLNLRADDDGFVNNHKSILRKVGANANDYQLLVAKRFILEFESGVIVIKHWKMHNCIRTDRKQDTQFQKEFNMLTLRPDNAYTEKNNEKNDVCGQVTAKCQSSDSKMAPQYSIGKDSIGKNNNNILSTKVSNILSVSKNETDDIIPFSDESILIFNLWNSADIIQHRTLTDDIEKAINKAVALYGVDKVCEGVRNYSIIFNDKNYFFNYKWKLIEFIKRSNALPTFFNEGDKWQNYLNSKGGKKAQENEILNQVHFSDGWFN